MSVFDADKNILYSWPDNTSAKNSIASPDTWGDIISPDKSLPELNLPIIVFIISILTLIILQSKTKSLIKCF